MGDLYEPEIAGEPLDDRADPRPPDLTDGWRFSTWTTLLAIVYFVYDRRLYLKFGYMGTITASTRRVFRWMPWTAFFVGVGVGGLETHFFFSHPAWRLMMTAFVLFTLGRLTGFLVVYFRHWG